MPRFYLRLTLIPIALFTLVLFLIHAQPYDDHELRELLLPEGCSAPCLMGITAKVTTVDEAIKLLENLKWVGAIEKQIDPSSGKLAKINWTWNDLAPSYLQLANDAPFKTSPGSMGVADNIITSIGIRTSISFGDLWQLWNNPSDYVLTTFPTGSIESAWINYVGDYRDIGYSFSGHVDCLTQPNLWNSKVTIVGGWIFEDQDKNLVGDRFADRLFLVRFRLWFRQNCWR